MQLKDIGTISASGRYTNAYTRADDTAVIEVPDDHENPVNAAHRAAMLYLAEREWKSGETILQARARMRDYLKENPLVEAGTGRELASGLGTIIFTEG